MNPGTILPDGADSSPVDRIVAAVVERYGRFLICQRPQSQRHGGKWEFPGGAVHPGESIALAATRVLAKKLELVVSDVDDELLALCDGESQLETAFVRVVAEGLPACREHAAHAWARVEELASFDLVPGHAEFADALVKQGRAA
jgi:ADP-ribose pyrophosphatase YjhB (NUDIX family)